MRDKRLSSVITVLPLHVSCKLSRAVVPGLRPKDFPRVSPPFLHTEKLKSIYEKNLHIIGKNGNTNRSGRNSTIKIYPYRIHLHTKHAGIQFAVLRRLQSETSTLYFQLQCMRLPDCYSIGCCQMFSILLGTNIQKSESILSNYNMVITFVVINHTR